MGARTQAEPHRFALDFVAALGVRLAPAVAAAATGATLVDAAGGLEAGAPVLPGDLVVFDAGWLVGVVTAVQPWGAVEFLYVQRGRVRRGFVTPGRPDVRRDAEGRALNTFIRPYDAADRPEQRYLAGQLFSGFLTLGRLRAT